MAFIWLKTEEFRIIWSSSRYPPWPSRHIFNIISHSNSGKFLNSSHFRLFSSFACVCVSPTYLCFSHVDFSNGNVSPSSYSSNPQTTLEVSTNLSSFKKKNPTFNYLSPTSFADSTSYSTESPTPVVLDESSISLNSFFQVLHWTGISLRIVILLYNFMSFAVLSTVLVIWKMLI